MYMHAMWVRDARYKICAHVPPLPIEPLRGASGCVGKHWTIVLQTSGGKVVNVLVETVRKAPVY